MGDNGRKDGVVHELIRVAPESDDEYLVGLRCEREALFGAFYGRAPALPLYGPLVLSLVDDPIDCMACIVSRFA
jgi:hypothetical protein